MENRIVTEDPIELRTVGGKLAFVQSRQFGRCLGFRLRGFHGLGFFASLVVFHLSLLSATFGRAGYLRVFRSLSSHGVRGRTDVHENLLQNLLQMGLNEKRPRLL